MKAKVLLVLGILCLAFVASCDSSETPKYLEFSTKMLLPQAPIGKAYDFTFTVTYGEDKWDADTGYADSEIVWNFSNWKLNNVEQTDGPANMTFEDGKITGTADAADGGLWAFDVMIEMGKKTAVETFFMPIAKNVEIMTDTVLPLATTELDYTAYLSAQYGNMPYYWNFDNWTKDGSPVNDPPVGLTFSGAGFINGQADNSEVGDWTFDATVFDTTVPGQLTDSKSFELKIKLKLMVPTNYPTIQAAVDAAESGETIYLEAGTFQGAGNRDVNLQGKALTILGDPQAPNTVIIDCEGTSNDPHRAFLMDNGEKGCVFDGLRIINGHALETGGGFRGGAIYAGSGVDFTVQNCEFEDIKTTSQDKYIYGGVISGAGQNEFKMKNCSIKNTEVTTVSSYHIYGGVIYMYSNSETEMENVMISGTTVMSGYYIYGGELYFYSSSTADVKNVVMSGGSYKGTNNRYMYGGYIYGTSMTATYENVYFVNADMTTTYSSYARTYGSVAYLSSCTTKFINCVFANNTWKYIGTYSYYYEYGMFYLTSGSSSFEDCIISGNEILQPQNSMYLYGQIAYISSHTAKFKRSHFLMNTATTNYTSTSYSYNGGGVRVYSSGTAEFDSCVFAHNKAGLGAGAISANYSSSNTTVNNTTFYNNEGYAGGAMFCYGTVTINNSVMWGNSASYGGTEIYVYSGTPIVNNSCYTASGISGSITPTSCVTTDPYFKDTGDNAVTGDCTFSDATMTVTGTPGTSAFLSEIMRGDLIYLTADGVSKALAVVEVVSDTELKVAGLYKGTPGTGAATVTKANFNLQHTSKGDANDSPCVDSGDNSKVTSSTDVAGNTRIVDGNSNGTPTVDMGAYEMQ